MDKHWYKIIRNDEVIGQIFEYIPCNGDTAWDKIDTNLCKECTYTYNKDACGRLNIEYQGCLLVKD